MNDNIKQGEKNDNITIEDQCKLKFDKTTEQNDIQNDTDTEYKYDIKTEEESSIKDDNQFDKISSDRVLNNLKVMNWY